MKGEEMAGRIVGELVSRGRLPGDERDHVQDVRVVAEVLRGCLIEAWRSSMSAGPIAATLDEIERDPQLSEPFEEETTQP